MMWNRLENIVDEMSPFGTNLQVIEFILSWIYSISNNDPPKTTVTDVCGKTV